VFDKDGVILPNGADSSIYVRDSAAPRKKKIVYASSPDRGLHWLLEAFPEIRRRVPDVTLDIYYDWEPFYLAVKDGNSETSFRLRYCKEMLDRLKNKGVVHHGSTSREKMIDVFKSSRVLAYPCDTVSYTEGFSVTTLEAAMSGCVPVLAGADALQEVYGGHVPTVPAPYSKHKLEYLEKVVDLLRDDVLCSQAQDKAVELSSLYSWEKLGIRLIDLL
jgi:glycosyltransferase involved in cell wall biosynthesis